MKNNTYVLKLGKSKHLVDGFFDRYNDSKDLKFRLRASHKSLVNAMLYYFLQTIKKGSILNSIKEGEELPVLRTNNRQLAQRVGVCEKTVRNLRKRLETAKIILNSTGNGGSTKNGTWESTGSFHGSNSSFEVILNPAILFISKVGDSANLVLKFSKNYTPQPDFSAPTGKSLPHTVSCTNQVTSKLNKLEGVNFQQSTGNQSVKGKSNVDNLLKTCGKLPEDVENQQLKPIQGTHEPDSGYARSKTNFKNSPPVPAAPPTDQPETIQEVTGHLPEKQQKRIDLITSNILSIAIINLYPNRWLNDYEKEKAKAALAEYFAYSDPARYTAGSNEITRRIFLVKRWLEKREKQGLSGWKTPIPSAYFNIRNKAGFAQTKTWFKGDQKQRQEINFKTEVSKSVNVYMKALNGETELSQAETYRRITQRLGKKSQALLDAFNAQIMNLQTLSA